MKAKQLVIVTLTAIILAGGWLAWSLFGKAAIGSSKLVIAEWQVAIPLTPDINDASYAINPDGQAHVTTTRLTGLIRQVPGCTSGFDNAYIQRSATKPSGSYYTWGPIQAAGYYYYPGTVLTTACVSASNPEIEQLDASLRKALSQLSAQ